MLIREIINQINHADIIYDNESVSLPVFKEEKGHMNMIFFTYHFYFDSKSEKSSVSLGRGIKITEGGELSFFELNSIELGEKLIFSCGKREERVKYQDVLQSMQTMIDRDFALEEARQYALDFNSYVLKELTLPYWELGEEYFGWLRDVCGF